ncbi:MAG: NmrA family NAD(P)-binding protein [Bryobacterales bacterium]|nr:NmrA family NAD(P)-binding protein [Bryobacterales bacterium]
MKRVLLLGATGNLGSLMGKALLARGAVLRLLVRPESVAKVPAELAGAEVVTDEAGAFAGVDVVISAVQGGPETIVEAQLRWLRAARAAGVRRFIPSDFSFDFFGLGEGENVNSDWRRAFARAAAQEAGDVEVVHVMNGCFLDHRVLFGFLGAIDLEKREAYLWGDGDQKMEFTTYADTAEFTAEAALDERPLAGRFAVAGESLTFPELVKEVEAGAGVSLTVVRRGSLADLDAAIAKAQAEQPGNMYAWLPMMYWRGMLNGKGALGPVRNGEYPAIRAMGVRAYLAG